MEDWELYRALKLYSVTSHCSVVAVDDADAVVAVVSPAKIIVKLHDSSNFEKKHF